MLTDLVDAVIAAHKRSSVKATLDRARLAARGCVDLPDCSGVAVQPEREVPRRGDGHRAVHVRVILERAALLRAIGAPTATASAGGSVAGAALVVALGAGGAAAGYRCSDGHHQCRRERRRCRTGGGRCRCGRVVVAGSAVTARSY